MWNSIRADEFCESVRDGTHDTPKQQSFGYKLVTSKHIQDGLIQPYDAYYISEDDYKKINERSKVEKWDVLMAMIGNGLGRSAIVESNPDYAIKNIALFKMGGNEVKAKWLHYFLSTNYTQQVIINYLQGTGQPFLSLSLLRKFKVPNPPLPTQQKIASILSAYDNLIQNYKKQIETLQTAASELYKEWFVRFRFPGYQTTKFENGIPEGWKIERLGNLFEITSSKRVFEEDYVNEGIPFYRSKEIIELSNNQEITTELFISNELYAKFKNKFGVPKENDILITSVGSIGNSYQVRKDDIFYFKDGNLTWIKSSSKKALSKYLIYWLKSDLGKNTLISSTIGTSQSALTIEKLRAIKILVPEVNILEKFEQKISSFDIKIQILNKQIANLTQQRDLLLPRLMSGKLEVE